MDEYTPEQSLLIYVLIQAILDKDKGWLNGVGFNVLSDYLDTNPNILRKTINRFVRKS